MTIPLGGSPWLHCPRPVPSARLRLYAFPYAGGGAAVFFPWAPALAPEIEVWAIRLPGRETRMREPAFTSFPVLITALEQEVAPRLRPPYAFFGHSLGALIAFAFASALMRRGPSAPAALVVAGARPPHLPNLEANIGDVPDAQLISELRDRYNGIPPAVLAHPELLGLVLPLLRADIRLYEDYRHTPALPLHLPLAAYGGSLDPIVSPESLSNWQVHTAGPFQTRRFNGEHFFLQSDAAAVIGAAKRFFLDAVP